MWYIFFAFQSEWTQNETFISLISQITQDIQDDWNTSVEYAGLCCWGSEHDDLSMVVDDITGHGANTKWKILSDWEHFAGWIGEQAEARRRIPSTWNMLVLEFDTPVLLSSTSVVVFHMNFAMTLVKYCYFFFSSWQYTYDKQKLALSERSRYFYFLNIKS